MYNVYLLLTIIPCRRRRAVGQVQIRNECFVMHDSLVFG